MKVSEAISHVIKNVRFVQNDGKNAHFGYSYASEAAMMAAVRGHMADVGLAIVPCGQKVLRIWETKTRAGRMDTNVEVLTTWALICGDESVEVQTIGGGQDSGEKAVFKAQTGSLKYALRQVFLLPTGDDAERENIEAMQQTDAETAEAAEANRKATKAKAMRWLGPACTVAGCTYAQLNAWVQTIEAMRPLCQPELAAADERVIHKVLTGLGLFRGTDGKWDINVEVDTARHVELHEYLGRCDEGAA